MKTTTLMMKGQGTTRLVTGAGLAGLLLAGGACDDAAGRAGAALTVEQLAIELGSAPVRVEVTLRADGTVRELEVEDEGPGHEAELEGRVLSVDVANGRLEVAQLGTVDAAAATRFRTEAESNVDAAQFWQNLEAAVASGQAVWVDARGAFGAEVFVANELRWEDDTKTKVEADIDGGALDLAARTVTIGGRVFSLATARIQYDDGDDNGDDDGFDDNGDDDINDDNGGDRGDDASDDDRNDDNGGDRNDDASDDDRDADSGADDRADDNGGVDDDDDGAEAEHAEDEAEQADDEAAEADEADEADEAEADHAEGDEAEADAETDA